MFKRGNMENKKQAEKPMPQDTSVSEKMGKLLVEHFPDAKFVLVAQDDEGFGVGTNARAHEMVGLLEAARVVARVTFTHKMAELK